MAGEFTLRIRCMERSTASFIRTGSAGGWSRLTPNRVAGSSSIVISLSTGRGAWCRTKCACRAATRLPIPIATPDISTASCRRAAMLSRYCDARALAVAVPSRSLVLSRWLTGDGLVLRWGAGLPSPPSICRRAVADPDRHRAFAVYSSCRRNGLGIGCHYRPPAAADGRRRRAYPMGALSPGVRLSPPGADRHADRARRPPGVVLFYGERPRRWPHAGPGGVLGVLFGQRSERHDYCGCVDHLARRGRHPYGSHGERQRNYR